jgi:hypothetical protein
MNRHFWIFAALPALAGCGQTSIPDQLASPSAALCADDRVRQALALTLAPDTRGAKARIVPDSKIGTGMMDGLAAGLGYALTEVRLVAGNAAARTADCAATLTVSASQYGLSGTPTPIRYRIAPAAAAPGFTVTGDEAARDAAQVAFLQAARGLDPTLAPDEAAADRARSLLESAPAGADPLDAGTTNAAIDFQRGTPR